MASSISIPATSFSNAVPQMGVAAVSTRLANIDALRGFVMVLMPLDHLRETWFVNYAVDDPYSAGSGLIAIGFARFTRCGPYCTSAT